MSNYHFHYGELENLFHVIGSADRDSLRAVGIQLGEEFRPPTTDEEDEYYDSNSEEEIENWDVEDEEQQTATEVITQMIMTGLPADLAEDQSYAIQDYFAGMVQRHDECMPLDIEDIREYLKLPPGSAMMAAVRRCLAEGIEGGDLERFLEWLEERQAGNELRTRIQMIFFGRVPESDEPAYSDLETDAYLPRFGFLLAAECAQIVGQLETLTPDATDEFGPAIPVLLGVVRYCAEHERDLAVTISD